MSRKLTVNIEVIDPRVGDNFGFKVSNDGQYLTFTQSGLPDSIGWDKTYVGSGGTTSVVQVNRFLQLDSDLNIMATQSYGGVTNGSIACVLAPSSIVPSNSVAFVGNFTQWTRDNINIITSNRIISVQPTSYTNYGSGLDFYAGKIVEDNTGAANYIAGSFSNYKGYVTNNFVKTNAVGGISNTFRDNMMSNPNASQRGFNSQVKAVAVQSDGKVLCGGWFTNFNGNARNRIVRLTSLGQLDSFNVGTGFDSDVNDFAIQSDGKIICVGAFTKYFTTSTTKNRIVRISNLGAIDTGFTTTGLFGGPGDVIECVKLQSDGKILVGGFFTNGIARLLTGGGIDPSFTVGTGFAYSLGNARVFTIEVLTTGKIVVGGTFDSYNGNPCGHIVMLNSDGTFYKSLTLNYGIMDFGAGVVRSIKRDSANNLYVGGNFTNYLVSTVYVATGDLYSIPIGAEQPINYGSGFNYATGATVSSGTGFNNASPVRVAVKDSDDSLVAVGNFNSYNGSASKGIIKLNKYLGVDIAVGGSGTDGFGALPILSLARTALGKYIVSALGTYEGTFYNGGLYRLNSNLTNDTTWNSGNVGPDSSFPTKILCVPAWGTLDCDTVIIDPAITDYDGNAITTGVYCLNESGNYDTGFSLGSGWSSAPLTMDIHQSGVIFAGSFTTFKGASHNRLVKLTSAGATSSTNMGTGFNSGSVNFVKTGQGDKVYCFGTFTSFNGTARAGFLRLNSDFSLDTGFTVGTGFNGAVNSLIEDSVGNVYVTGSFTTYNGNTVNRLCRLTSSGAYDSSFVIGTSLNNTGDYVNMINTDKIIVMGRFTTYKGLTNSGVVMLDSVGTPVTSIGNFGNRMEVNANPSGDLVVVGNYTTYNGTASNQISKIDYTGDILNVVGTDGIENLYTQKFVMKGDGKMVLFCDKYEGVTASGKAIGVNNDLTVDSSFISQGFNFTPTIKDISVLNDNSFYLVGNDLGYGSATSSGVSAVRISSTGSLITNLGLGNDTINTVDVCPITGKVAIAGLFGYAGDPGYPFIGGTGSRNYINLIVTQADGVTIDNSFDNLFTFAGTSSIDKVRWSSDGRLLVIGNFNRYRNTSNVVNKFVRLNADGSLDPQLTSNVTTAFNGPVNGISFIDTYDPVLDTTEVSSMIYGDFTTYNGVATPYILKLNSDGSLNTSFQTGTGFNNNVDSATIVDDNIFCVGSISSYNGVTLPSARIAMLNKDGLLTLTASAVYETVQNTYDNLSEFNMAPGVTYSIVNNIVRMEYTFDDDEIVVQDLFDVPEHVELSYTNESININERINEIVTRSDHKIKTKETGTFSYTNFKIRIYEGSLFSGVTASPVKYNITKPKIVSTQKNVYIDVSNLIKEDFEWNIGYFYSNDITNAADLPENISKWVYIEETNYLGTASVSLEKHYLYAIDGYLLNNEIQHLPNLLVNGSKRYVHRDQQQRIYFQTNFLTGIQIIPEVGFSYTPSFDVNTSLNNTSYVQSLSIDKPADARYIDYIFTYADSVETVRYYFYGEFGNCGKEYQELIFKNKWGVLESLAVPKKSKINLNSIGEDYTRSIVDYNGNYDVTRHTNRKFDVDMEESFILNTDVLPEYMTDSIIDLYASDEVWLKNDNGYTPVVVDGSVNDLKRRIDGPISYNIKVNASHRKIKNIL